MSWQTKPWVVALRHVGRTVGLNRWIARCLYGRGYETRYDQAFTAQLKSGDVVWDVGANVGYYTGLFAEKVGASGKVVAFEPSPANFTRLRQACGALVNVRLYPLGLGREEGSVMFLQGQDELGATSRVVEDASPQSGAISVAIRPGVGLILSGDAPSPNAIKIDVEGFELEVLQGLGSALAAPDLRAIGIEVHFGLLQQRGMSDAPQRIEELLKQHGYRLQWPDTSHLLAIRA